MIGWLLRRLLLAALLLFAVTSGSFVLVRSLPGGPFDDSRSLDPVIEANLRAAYDLDASTGEQYLRYLAGIARLDFGPSLRYRDHDVNSILAESLPISLLLGTCGLMVALAVGLGAGLIAARRPGGAIDGTVMAAASIGLAVPNFVLAGLAVLLFCFRWPVLPVAGWGAPAQIVLPALTLGLPYAAAIARLFRGGLLEIRGEDWMRTARAKGLTAGQALRRHGARVALLPVLSFLGPALAGLLSGSLVIERIFAIAGMGSHLVDSAFHADYNLALGVIIVTTALVSLLNLAVDATYALLDPRIEAPR